MWIVIRRCFIVCFSFILVCLCLCLCARAQALQRRSAMARWMAAPSKCSLQGLGLCMLILFTTSAKGDPTPKTWPLQFHAEMYQNRTGKLTMVDLWYDFPNGRNLNLLQKQLGPLTHDVEYTNGTSYYFDLKAGTCREVLFPVGILRPDWLSDATFVGVEEIDGFTCNVFEKVDFIRYWEDIKTHRPVSWRFTKSGMWLHVMTFEEGNVLEDRKWQAPASCFERSASAKIASKVDDQSRLGLLSKVSVGVYANSFSNEEISLKL